MTTRPSNAALGRPGLSLLEVLVALAIFLFAMVAIGRLVVSGADRALEVRYKSEAVQIAQTKLAEAASGAVALSSQGASPLDEDPEWQWSLDAEQGSVANLWNVTVRVSRAGPGGSPMEYCSLTQMVLDPAQRGSSFDTVAVSDSGTAAPAGGTGGTPSQGSSAGGAGAAGGAAGGGRGPAAGGGAMGGGAMPGGGAPGGFGGGAPAGGFGGGAAPGGLGGGAAPGGFGGGAAPGGAGVAGPVPGRRGR
jgi:general secretion pathway protein I